MDIDSQLSQACRAGDITLVQQALDDGANPRAHDSACLLEACRGGSLLVVKLLLALPEDKRPSVGGGHVVFNVFIEPLGEACASGNVQLVEYLLFGPPEARASATGLGGKESWYEGEALSQVEEQPSGIKERMGRLLWRHYKEQDAFETFMKHCKEGPSVLDVLLMEIAETHPQVLDASLYPIVADLPSWKAWSEKKLIMAGISSDQPSRPKAM